MNIIIQKIKNFFRKKEVENKEPKLKLLFEDKKGRKFYTFYNSLDMPYKRAIQAESMSRFAEFGITKDRLIEFVKQFREASNKKDNIKIDWLIVELETNIYTIAEELTLLNLAACYVVEEGENINEINDQVISRKIEYWSKDAEAVNFFLEFAWILTKQYGNHSQIDIQNYLKKVRKNPLYRSLHSVGYKNSVIK